MSVKRALFFVSVLALLGACATSPPEQPVRDEPITPSAASYVVRAQEMWDDPAGAATAYTRAIELDPAFALAYLGRARLVRGEGRPADAVRDYSAAIDADPGLVQAYRERGEVRMWELGDEGGRDDFRTAYEIDPDDLQTALAYAGLVQWDDPDLAGSIYDRMVEHYPGRAGALVARAKFRRDRADFSGAAADFRDAVAAGEKYPGIYVDLIMAQLAVGDRDAARNDLATLVREAPDAPETALVQARVAALLGDAGRALERYPRYFEQEWADARVWLEVAYVAAAADRPALAREAIDRYEAQKNDELRVAATRAGVGLLLGRTDEAVASLGALVAEHDWFFEAWYLLALVPHDGRVAARTVVADRTRDLKPSPRAFLPFNPDIWVFTRLYLDRDAGAEPAIPLP